MVRCSLNMLGNAGYVLIGKVTGTRRMETLENIVHETKGRKLDWRKSMSDNVAVALIAYTGLNIFLTVDAIKETGLRGLAMLCLVILVAGIIPACHKLEKRWRDLPDEAAHDPALAGPYRRDQVLLWLLALGLPFGLTALFHSLG